jgi:hypothetical protein
MMASARIRTPQPADPDRAHGESFDDVTAAYHRGELSDSQYDTLAEATAESKCAGNFSGRQYSVTRGGVQAAAVTQLRALRERFVIEITDGEDPVLMLAVVLVIETIRDDRRRRAAASG